MVNQHRCGFEFSQSEQALTEAWCRRTFQSLCSAKFFQIYLAAKVLLQKSCDLCPLMGPFPVGISTAGEQQWLFLIGILSTHRPQSICVHIHILSAMRTIYVYNVTLKTKFICLPVVAYMAL